MIIIIITTLLRPRLATPISILQDYCNIIFVNLTVVKSCGQIDRNQGICNIGVCSFFKSCVFLYSYLTVFFFKARAVERLATSFESIGASTHDVRNAMVDIDCTLKRLYDSAPAQYMQPGNTRLGATITKNYFLNKTSYYLSRMYTSNN